MYTPDYIVRFNERALIEGKLISYLSVGVVFPDMKRILCQVIDGTFVAHIEVKADRRDDYNTERFFLSRTQPEMFEKFNIYVNLVKPLTLFKNSFVPKALMNEFYYKKDVYIGKGDTKKLKARIGDKKHKFDYRTLEEFVNNKASN